MAKSAIITLTTAGTDTGPFNLLSDVDSYVSPFESNIAKSSLVAGYTTNLVPDAATIIRVQSTSSLCTNYIDLNYPASSTTTTTTTSTTTTTTTTTPPTSSCVEIEFTNEQVEYLNCGVDDLYRAYTASFFTNCTASNAPEDIFVYFTASGGSPVTTSIYTLIINSGSHQGFEDVYTRIWAGDCFNKVSTDYTVSGFNIVPSYVTCSCPTGSTTTTTTTSTTTTTTTPEPTTTTTTTTTTSTTTTTTTSEPEPVYNYYTLSPCAGGGGTDYRSILALQLGDVYAFQDSPPDRACYEITSISATPNSNDLPTLYGPKLGGCLDDDCQQL